jgi:hypothetical protein
MSDEQHHQHRSRRNNANAKKVSRALIPLEFELLSNDKLRSTSLDPDIQYDA